MHAHDLNSFVRPFLKVDRIEVSNDAELELQFEEVELQISAHDPRTIAEGLAALRSPDAPQWRNILADKSDGTWPGLLNQLQHFGLVHEALHPAKAITAHQDQVHELLAELRALAQEIDMPDAACLRDIARVLKPESEQNDLALLQTEKNLFLLCLKLSIKAWRTNCPPALDLAERFLAGLLGEETGEKRMPSLACYSIQEMRRCMLVFVWCLHRSCAPDAQRLLTQAPLATMPTMGVNLALMTEKWAVKALADLGPSPFTEALREPATQLRLAQASYAQEYYITERFVDIIAPAISHRLPRPLKKLVRKYYSEEIGHDKYELKTCERLGLPFDMLQAGLPTPFSQILCDVFTYLALHDPISYFSAITITEGLPGQPNVLNSVIAESGVLPEDCNHESRHHEELNENLRHPMISRIFLAQCGELDEETQQRAFAFYGALLEVGWRTWNELHRMHVQFGKPAVNSRIRDFFPAVQ